MNSWCDECSNIIMNYTTPPENKNNIQGTYFLAFMGVITSGYNTLMEAIIASENSHLDCAIWDIDNNPIKLPAGFLRSLMRCETDACKRKFQEIFN
jgi:hypothetical protein